MTSSYYQRATKPRPTGRSGPDPESAAERPGLTGDARIDAAIDRICHQGCRKVRRYIEVLAADEPHPELDGLDRYQRRRLHDELCDIMRVYGDSCRI